MEKTEFHGEKINNNFKSLLRGNSSPDISLLPFGDSYQNLPQPVKRGDSGTFLTKNRREKAGMTAWRRAGELLLSV